MKAIDMRPGQGMKMDNKLWVVTAYEFRNPGNLRSFVNLKIRDIQRGGIIERRFQPSEDVELIEIDRRPMEYLYQEGKDAVFMDSENYEQYTLTEAVLNGALQFIRPNSSATISLYDGRPILVELPPSVELVVKETTPSVKNATVTNVMKDATMETGLKTKVPDFIGEGETVRISTADGSYQSRA